MSSTTEQVLAVERGFWDKSADPSYYESNLDDQAISVMPMGFIPKSDAVEMTKQSKGWSDLEMSDVKIAELTPDCVALAYHGQAKSNDTGKPYRATISSVYVLRNGNWKLGLTSHQPWADGEGKGEEK